MPGSVTLDTTTAIERAIAPSTEVLRSLLGLEAPTDAEAVHRARTATRRLRSNLRSLEEVMGTTVNLGSELAWLGDELGELRDTDVLIERIDAEAAAVPSELRAGAAALRATLTGERGAANERLRRGLASVRFGNLIHELDLAAKEGSAATGTVDAAEVVSPRWRGLRDAVRRLAEPPTDPQLHEVRIEAKRLRYAAEIFEPVAGRAGQRCVRRTTRLQDALGAQHDAARAVRWLLAYEAADPAVARAAGWLAARAAAERDAARDAWRPRWVSLRKPKARFW